MVITVLPTACGANSNNTGSVTLPFVNTGSPQASDGATNGAGASFVITVNAVVGANFCELGNTACTNTLPASTTPPAAPPAPILMTGPAERTGYSVSTDPATSAGVPQPQTLSVASTSATVPLTFTGSAATIASSGVGCVGYAATALQLGGTTASNGSQTGWLRTAVPNSTATSASSNNLTVSVDPAVWDTLPPLRGAVTPAAGCAYTGTVSIASAGAGDTPQVVAFAFTKLPQAVNVSTLPTSISLTGAQGAGLTTTGFTNLNGAAPAFTPTLVGGALSPTFNIVGATANGPGGSAYVGLPAPADTAGSPLVFNSTAGANPSGWLRLTCNSTCASATPGQVVTVSADPSNLAPGTYNGAVLIRQGTSIGAAGNSDSGLAALEAGMIPLWIPVTLTVTPPPSLTLGSTAQQTFTFTQGGANPANQTVTVQSTPVASTMNYTVTPSSTQACGGSTWLMAAAAGAPLAVTPTAGITHNPVLPADVITTSINPACLTGGTALGVGIYIGNVQVSAPTAAVQIQTISVSLTINAAVVPVINAPTTQLNFSFNVGGAPIIPQTVTVTTTPSSGVIVTATPSQPWLSASLVGTTLTVSVEQSAGLGQGAYNGNVTLSASGAANVVIPVALNLSQNPVSVGVYRSNVGAGGGLWIVDSNFNQVMDAPDQITALGGLVGDIPVYGDWNGTGTTKKGIYRNGTWLLDFNGTGAFTTTYHFGGVAGDYPVVGDWNHTGYSKIGIFRQGFFWLLDVNGNGTFDGTGAGQDAAFSYGGVTGCAGGAASLVYPYNVISAAVPGACDIPVVGDWNNDGTTKVGVVRAGFLWILDLNGTHVASFSPSNVFAYGGIAGDLPVVGDWNNTGTSKVGVYRGNGTAGAQPFFFVLDINGDRSFTAIPPDAAFAYGGVVGDIPVVGRWN